MPTGEARPAPQESPVRTALRPRMLALLALALGLAVVFAELGSWQIGRARSADQAPPERAVVPISQVLAPQEQLGADAVAGPVSATGTWADVPSQRVVDRAADGGAGDGAWVIAALDVDGTASDGAGPARLPVVLGFLPAGQPLPAAPVGDVEVTGELAVSQDPRGTAGLPAGELATASSADLLNVWGGPIYAGYLVPQEPLAGLGAVPPPQRETGTNLQNVSYAFQWWVFAGFAVLMWLRVVHDVRRRERERAEDEADERLAAHAAHQTHDPRAGTDPADRRPQEASR
ncbi:SURF1 family cytochrome oxidase biogenesis protein [Pseudokineococcus basanitobsidens]|uniref:SURF1-like protein n=1 Tax=Pseudokineococcus basanitobsidens TaxID=1926649 RepID=A0ABU8RH39_9ACTN